MNIYTYVRHVQYETCNDDYNFRSEPVQLKSPLVGRLLNGCVALANGLRTIDIAHDSSADCSEWVSPDLFIPVDESSGP